MTHSYKDFANPLRSLALECVVIGQTEERYCSCDQIDFTDWPKDLRAACGFCRTVDQVEKRIRDAFAESGGLDLLLRQAQETASVATNVLPLPDAIATPNRVIPSGGDSGCIKCGANLIVGATLTVGPFCRRCWDDIKAKVRIVDAENAAADADSPAVGQAQAPL